jgi:putative two-component system response regulator
VLAEEERPKQLRILAVDDQPWNALLLRRILEQAGYTQVETITDPTRVVEMFVRTKPDLVLLDLHMPVIDGFELMRQLAPLTDGGRSVPFMVLTADDSDAIRRRALAAGARDFLTKPFDQTELLLRVRNLLEIKLLQDRLRQQNHSLEVQVAARTRDLEQARAEILDRLALAAEYRDDATQGHARRIGRTCAHIAAALGLPAAEVELIRRAAPLHDVGKIGVPDAILLKDGSLTRSEFALIKAHATIGGQILSGGGTPLLRVAADIALTHHERWDGTGYPHGLTAEEIPLPGRITSVADVFDALTHDRPYKQAWPLTLAVAEIVEQAGRQFDPDVVQAFSTLDHAMLLSPARHADPAGNGGHVYVPDEQPILSAPATARRQTA